MDKLRDGLYCPADRSPEADMIDWKDCPDVERNPQKVSGLLSRTPPLLTRSRSTPTNLLLEEIATEIFEGVTPET